MNIELTKLRSSKMPHNSQVVIPRVYVDDNDINAGDSVDIYRGKINGRDAIIILPVTDINLSIDNYKNLVNNHKKQETIQNN